MRWEVVAVVWWVVAIGLGVVAMELDGLGVVAMELDGFAMVLEVDTTCIVILVLLTGAGLTGWNEDIFFTNKKNNRK